MTQSLLERVAELRDQGVARAKIGLTDVDGVVRGKYISLEKLEGLARQPGGFCDCVFGWDVDDQLYDNAAFTGWHTAFPDALYRLDVDTERWLADEGIPYFIGEFLDRDGASPHPICPRTRLKSVLEQAAGMGFGVKLGFEYEFFVFDETPHSVREKGYRDLRPLSPGNFGYSVLRASVHSELFNGLMEFCDSLDFPLEGLHCETGPGAWEAALAADEALSAADKAVLFKTFTKVFFQKRALLATFMAKWSMDYPGQSGHCHLSVFDRKSGTNLFYDADSEHRMSTLGRHFLAGVQRFMRPFLALYAPTVNSYTRLVKGAWAPTAATWGYENRTCALRVIGGSEKAQRIEFRVGAADGNPYLVAMALVAAGLIGVRSKLEPTEPVSGNAYEVELAQEFQLPGNLRDAARELQASRDARQLFGDEFVEHYVASREWECREYERNVNDWQLKRYFEII